MDTQMDINSTFSEVWARVTGGRSDKSDTETLAGLISIELENSEFYSSALKCLSGAAVSLFRELLCESSKRLSKLQAMYFLSNGDSAPQKGAVSAADTGTLAALRSAYRRETETAANYRRASMELNESSLISMAMLFAEQAASGAGRIAALTEKLMR